MGYCKRPAEPWLGVRGATFASRRRHEPLERPVVDPREGRQFDDIDPALAGLAFRDVRLRFLEKPGGGGLRQSRSPACFEKPAEEELIGGAGAVDHPESIPAGGGQTQNRIFTSVARDGDSTMATAGSGLARLSMNHTVTQFLYAPMTDVERNTALHHIYAVADALRVTPDRLLRPGELSSTLPDPGWERDALSDSPRLK